MRKRPAPVVAEKPEAPAPAVRPKTALPMPDDRVLVDATRAMIDAVRRQTEESASLRKVVESLAQGRGRPTRLDAVVERNGSGQMTKIVVTPVYGGG